MTVHIHPKSRPITKGWSQIGPRFPHRRAIHQKELSASFKTTLAKQENRRVHRLRQKIAAGKLTDTDAIIGVLDVSLSVKPPKVFIKENHRVIEKKPGVTRAA